MCLSSGWEPMNRAKPELLKHGPFVGDEEDRRELTDRRVGEVLQQWAAEQLGRRGERERHRCDRVAGGLRRGWTFASALSTDRNGP